MPNYSEASTPTEIIDKGKSFLNSADTEDDDIFNADKEKEAVDQIYYIALSIGIVLAIVVGIYIGIQFITSGVEGHLFLILKIRGLQGHKLT